MQVAQRAPHDDARPTSPLTRRPLLVARFKNAYAKVRTICMYANLPQNEQTTKNAANKSRSKINCFAFVPLQKWQIERSQRGYIDSSCRYLNLSGAAKQSLIVSLISMGAERRISSIAYQPSLIRHNFGFQIKNMLLKTLTKHLFDDHVFNCSLLMV